jgi:hypothetical protein
MYYSYVEIEYVATSFSPARTDLAVKLLRLFSQFSRLIASFVGSSVIGHGIMVGNIAR